MFNKNNFELFHGNCLEVLPTLEAESIDFCVVDPPYGGSKTKITKKNGKDWTSDFGQWDTFFTEWMPLVYRALKADSGMVVFVPEQRIETLIRDATAAGFEYVQGWFWTKCLHGNTKVYAKINNKVNIINIFQLEKCNSGVQLWDGEKWVNLVHCKKTHVERGEPALKIELRSGEQIICSQNHLWPTKDGLKYAKHLKAGESFVRCKLPDSALVSDSILDKNIAWFIGLYLAEGSKSSKKVGTKNAVVLQISGHINEVSYRLERIQEICKKIHATCTWTKSGDNGANIFVRGYIPTAIIDTYISGTSAKTKHLTSKCWEQSDEFLINLFNGYLDGDGGKEAKRYRLGFTRNRHLVNSFRTLAARTNLDIRLKENISYITGSDKEYPSISGSVRFPEDRYMPTKIGGRPTADSSEIISITKCKTRVLYDISVDESPNLFSLASGILTHNSNAAPSVRNVLQWSVEAMTYFRKGKHTLRIANRGKCPNIFHHPIVHHKHRFHPTQKPVALIVDILKYVSDEDQIILDCFNGSGTTGEACLKTGRKYVGIEQDENYFTKSLERLSKISNEKAGKIFAK